MANSPVDCLPGERPSTLARAGRQARGFGGDRGQRLTAGWALRCWIQALYGAASPGDVLLELLQKRLPEGAVRRCPAALARLDSGRGGVAMPAFCPSILSVLLEKRF